MMAKFNGNHRRSVPTLGSTNKRNKGNHAFLGNILMAINLIIMIVFFFSYVGDIAGEGSPTATAVSSSLSSSWLNETSLSSIASSSSSQQLKESEERLQCLKSVLERLPIGHGPRRKNNPGNRNQVWAHHFDARNRDLWNQDDRFRPMPLLKTDPKCSIWEVGAHKEALDTRQFLVDYGNSNNKCQFHAFEPIPEFYKELSNNWRAGGPVHTHNFGIGANHSELQVSKESLQGQATFIGGDGGGGQPSSSVDTTTVVIEDFKTAVEKAGGLPPTLLHMNCEGCEWTMLPEALEAGFLQSIPLIQVGTHNYGGKHGLGSRVWELCDRWQRLRQTHTPIVAMPFGWERWIRKDLYEPNKYW